MSLLIQFAYLQMLDVLTTVAFLARGVAEGNPIIRLVVALSPSPLGGLIAAKALALLMAGWCWHRGRARLLLRINILYAGVVLWNLLAVVACS